MARNWSEERQLYRVLRRFRDLTMIPPDAYVDNLRLAKRIRDIDGCVIECGVWRGGMSAGLAMVLGQHREYFLFDSFEGLPPAQEIDGPAAFEWQRNMSAPDYYDNCSAPVEFATNAMRRAGATSFHLVKGWFRETLPRFQPPSPIALLHLDADWYESTIVCLDHLFDRVAPGGLIVVDDYYTWDGCSRAVHDFLSRRSAIERIRNFRSICYLEKTPPRR
jgi:hypothetical protein